jgi:hypothetical protein
MTGDRAGIPAGAFLLDVGLRGGSSQDAQGEGEIK